MTAIKAARPAAHARTLAPFLVLALLVPVAACGGGVRAESGNDGASALAPPAHQTAFLDAATPPNTNPAAGVVGPAPGLGAYLAGRHAQDVSDGAAAAAYYRRALDADPDNVTLTRRAYFYLLGEGQGDEALALARRTLELDPTASVAPLVVAIGAAAREDYAGAWPYVAELPLQGLNSFLVPLLQGWILAGQGRADDALAALAPMAASEQFQPLHRFHSGLILDLAERPDAAWPHYAGAVAEDSRLTLRTVEAVASFLRRHDRAAEAEALIARFRALHPNSVLIQAVFDRFATQPADWRPIASARQGLAEALYGAASSVMQTGAMDTALMFARLSLMLDAEFPFGQMLVADILAAQGRLEDAAALYDAVPADSAKRFPVRLQLAETLERLGRAEDSAEVLQALAADYPDTAAPLIQLGDVKRRQERWGEAVAAYDAALDLIATPEPAHWSLLFSLGVALERGGDWTRAEETFLRALDLDPNQPLVLNYLGYSWIDRGENLERGEEMIERAVAMRPSDGFIVDSLGWVHYLLGDYAKAVAELERAVELTPADPTINDHLGDAYWRVGRTAEARFQWRRALSLDPDPELIDTIEGKLRDGLPAAAE